MSDAYKCDRCGLFFEGVAPTVLDVQHESLERGTYYAARRHHICAGCKEDFARWMRREATSVLMPKDGSLEQARGAYTCPRCWQCGITRIHGPMEVCPNREST